MNRPLGKNTIVVVTAPLVVDPRDGSTYRDWPFATKTTVRNCLVEPFPLAEKLNFEFNQDREYSQSAIRIYAPAQTVVVYTDRIEHDGLTWQVLGHPGLWFDFKSKRHHKAIIAVIRQG